MLQQTEAFDRATLTEGIGLKRRFTHLAMCDAGIEVSTCCYALNRYRPKAQPILPEAPLCTPADPQRPAFHQKLPPPHTHQYVFSEELNP